MKPPGSRCPARIARSAGLPARERDAYLVELPGVGVLLLSDDELAGGVEGLVLGAVVVSGGCEGDVDGVVVVGGEADGVRSPGRSPTRSLRDSVHPVSTPAPRARTHTPVSNLFIAVLLCSEFDPKM